MRTIICTTGTSVGRGVRCVAGEKEAYKQGIRERIRKEQDAHSKDWFSLVSAETKSLKAMDVSRDDAIYLLHTDTDDGLICAECVAELVKEMFGCSVTLKKIEGLQVKDAVRFRRQGMNNLFAVLKQLTEPYDYDESVKVLLNVTGGFKSVVPFVTLYGLLRRLDIVYIFEFSDSMILLPPLPVQFDYERLGQAAEALRKIQEEGAMKRDDFYACIPGLPYEDRSWYDCLLEGDGEEDGLVTLSAIAAQLLVARDEDRCQVQVSPSATLSLERADGIALWQFQFMLNQVGDPLWRRQHKHAYNGTNLEVYKPGNTAQRLAGLVQGHKFYVCELYANHDRYEKELKNHQREHYELSAFSLWTPPVDGTLPETEQDQVQQLSDRIKRLEKENEDTIREWERLQHENEAKSRDVRVAEENVQKLKTERDALKRKAMEQTKCEEQLRSSIQQKESELDRLNKRTFIQRLFNLKVIYDK